MFDKLKYEEGFCESFKKSYLNNGEQFMIQLDEYLENIFNESETNANIHYSKIMSLFNNTKNLDFVVYEFMPRLAVYLRLKYKLDSYLEGDCLIIKL